MTDKEGVIWGVKGANYWEVGYFLASAWNGMILT